MSSGTDLIGTWRPATAPRGRSRRIRAAIEYGVGANAQSALGAARAVRWLVD